RQVTALRFDFSWDPGVGLLQPGESVQIFYTTQTPEEMPAGVAEDSYPEAWNSIGGWAQTSTAAGFQYFRTAPLKAGISYAMSSSGELAKAGIGDDPMVIGTVSLS